MKINLDNQEIKEGYVRVSTLCKSLIKLSGNKEINRIAANRGTEVHKAIAIDIQGGCYPLEKDAQGFFESYSKWRQFVDYEFIHLETRLYDEKLKITGCLDAVVTRDGGKTLYLLDWKNTASLSKEYCRHQGMFYHHLATCNGIKLSTKMIFVQLDKRGKMPRLHFFDTSEILWRECLTLYNSHFAK